MIVLFEILLVLFVLFVFSTALFLKNAFQFNQKRAIFNQNLQSKVPHNTVVNNNIDYIV